tara:strand:+ start:2149 stop:2991 length:843 start_codon:yes stop_codon:yes gene_type:complete
VEHINLFDQNFGHSFAEDGFDTSTRHRKPVKVEWVRDQFNWSGITVFTDLCLSRASEVTSKYKVAWLIEPRSIHPHIYSEILLYEDDYDLILTFDGQLLKRSDKYKRCLFGGCWVSDDEWSIYPKTKGGSIIASWKKEAEGHKLRHTIIQACPQLDAWGKGIKPFDNKLEPLKDYMFSVVIENSSYDYYVTEKLIDCMSTGTVPIYWGCPSIGEIFNKEGIIHFSNFEEFTKLKLSKELYHEMLPAVKDNFERAKQYKSTDDHVASIILDNLQGYEDVLD